MSLKYKPGQSDRAAPADPGGAGELSVDALLTLLSHTHCLSWPLSLSLSLMPSRSLVPSPFLSRSLSRPLSLGSLASSVDGATRGGMQVQVTS